MADMPECQKSLHKLLTTFQRRKIDSQTRGIWRRECDIALLFKSLAKKRAAALSSQIYNEN